MVHKNTYKEAIENGYDFGTGVLNALSDDITISLDKFGQYQYHLTDEIPVSIQNKIEKVCSSSDGSQNETDISQELFGNTIGINFDTRIGYYKNLYIGHVSDGAIRSRSSSGGMVTWILVKLLEKNLIDGVIHVVKDDNDDSPLLFKYSISKTADEIISGAKTRYYPVEISEVLKEVLKEKENKRYAVVGLPSFITELRLLASINPIIKERIVFMIGLVCGHQKSSKFAEYLGWQLGFEPGSIDDIDFRKKVKSQPANRYAVEVTGKINGKKVVKQKQMHDILGRDWGEGFFKVKASDFTDDVMNETADITLGDAWLPEYSKDSDGNNIIIVRNVTIDKIVKNGIQSGELDVTSVNKDKIIQSQISHYRHTQDELGYRLWYEDKKKGWRPTKRIVASRNLPYTRKKIQDMRRIIAKNSHLLFLEAEKKNDLNVFIEPMNRLNRTYYNLKTIDNGPKSVLKKILKKIFRR